MLAKYSENILYLFWKVLLSVSVSDHTQHQKMQIHGVPAVSSENSYLVNVKMICTKAYCFYSVQNVISASDPMKPQTQNT